MIPYTAYDLRADARRLYGGRWRAGLLADLPGLSASTLASWVERDNPPDWLRAVLGWISRAKTPA